MKVSDKQKKITLNFLAGLILAIFLLPAISFAQEGQGVLNSSCAPDETIDCQAGLYCATNPDGTGTCKTPAGNTTPNTPGNVTSPSSNQGTCPDQLIPKNGLCLPANQYTTGVASSDSLADLIGKVVKGLLAFAGAIAVVFVIIGGYLYMSAGGNEEQAEKGRKTIVNFVLGLVVIILAYAIVTILISTLTGADKVLK